jgi:hypothetical protein
MAFFEVEEDVHQDPAAGLGALEEPRDAVRRRRNADDGPHDSPADGLVDEVIDGRPDPAELWLIPHREFDTGAVRRRDHRVGVLDCGRDRFFAKDVFARFGRGDDRRRMGNRPGRNVDPRRRGG